MTLDLLIVLACCILALMAHVSRQQEWVGLILRVIIGMFFVVEFFMCLGFASEILYGQLSEVGITSEQWSEAVTVSLASATGLMQFRQCRLALSYILTAIEQLVSGQVLLNLISTLRRQSVALTGMGNLIGSTLKQAQVLKNLVANRIFVPESMPHLVALWIYVTTICFLLGSIDPASVKLPLLPIPLPLPLDQLLSYNGLGLITLSFCGIGIFITRKPREALKRLAWQKPTLAQVILGISLIFLTFGYDYIWSLFTHPMAGNLASKLSNYNEGTFTAGGGFGPSLILALFTGLCAGAGEETLIRGALQPVLGILPAAVLHGLLHGQFSHAPIFLLQVAGWSVLMGIIKRYTNTTTTIIAHAGFNFLTTLLFAFSP